jgi:osmotically-inducible protein OsmY
MNRGLAEYPSPTAVRQGLAERVRRALCDSGYSGLDLVIVTIHEEMVTLRGSVPSYFMKQIAQEVVKATCGVKSLSNGLKVVAAPIHSG